MYLCYNFNVVKVIKLDMRFEMKYERIVEGVFKERPNRFIAHVEIDGKIEVVHVKNTGRCKELLIPNTKVYVQKACNLDRKTKWDLIGVKKDILLESGKTITRMVNMDSQITNYVVKEWINNGHMFTQECVVKSEVTYKKSRFDLYVELENRKIFIEVKGVTLENNGIVSFPDAPSERAVKHLNELIDAVKNGYEAVVFFVIQMKDVSYFTPNKKTHLEFANTLLAARKAGVKIVAYDCHVNHNEIILNQKVPVVLGEPNLFEIREDLVDWYLKNKRSLPWRENVNAYGVWVSEIMLQQTRVEAVKPFYMRFIETLPTIKSLAEAEEEVLLKLWEGLGYYNRVRNMQIAARSIMEEHGGIFPYEYEKILKLKGIGSYTAGAISSFAFGIPKAAVDGNVLRVLSRFLGDDTDITKCSLKKRVEENLNEIIPENYASEFGQGIIELGATVCVPNGEPKCEICPLNLKCVAYNENRIQELPVKSKAKDRRIEYRTVLIFKDKNKLAINKRGGKGLLAKMYELPNFPGHLEYDEVVKQSKVLGLHPIRIKECGEAKHLFSHVEWRMKGYVVFVDELEKSCTENFIFAEAEIIEKRYPIPSAFTRYMEYLDVRLGQQAYKE